MKRLLIAASVLFSVSANAAPCEDIARAAVDAFVETYNLPKTDGYAELIATNTKSCMQGVRARDLGMTPSEMGAATSQHYAKAKDLLSDKNGVIGFALSSYMTSAGYAYGE